MNSPRETGKRRKGILRLIKQIPPNEYDHRLSAIIAQPLPTPRTGNRGNSGSVIQNCSESQRIESNRVELYTREYHCCLSCTDLHSEQFDRRPAAGN